MSLRIKIGSTFLDSLPNEAIQVNYAVNKIGDLATRQGTTSNNFTVPLTAKNKNALGMNHILNNEGVNVNRRLDGVLYRNSTVVSKGFFQLTGVDIIEKTASLTFFSGIVDWLDAIRGKNICELNESLQVYNHNWTSAVAQDSFLNTQGYVYVPIANGRLIDRPLTTNEYGISSVSNDGGLLKITTTASHDFAVDDIIQLIDFSPSAINQGWRAVEIPAVDEVVIDLTFSPSIATDGSSLARKIAGITLEDLGPCVFVHTIFKAIFQEAGFVLKGNFLQDPFFKRLVIPFAGETVTNGNAYVNEYTSTQIENTADSFSDTYPGGVEEYYLSSPVYTVPSELGAIKVSISADIRLSDFLVSLTATTTPATTAQLDAAIAITKNQTVVLDSIPLGGVSSEFGGPTETDSFDELSVSFSFEDIELIAGDTIEFALLVTDGAISGATGSVDVDINTREIIITPDFEVPQEGRVFISEILPCIPQEDIVKWVAVSFGLFFQVDNFSKEIQVFTFEEVASGLQRANDWTSKIDSSQHQVSFTDIIGNYSKDNYLLYEADSNDEENKEYENITGKPFGSGFFEVDSDFVDGENDIYTAPFSGTFLTETLTGSGGSVLLPKIIRYSSGSLTYFEADQAPSNRILVYAGQIPISDLSNGQITSIDITGQDRSEIPFAYFYKQKIAYNIDAQNKSIAYSVQQVTNPNDYGLTELYWLAYRALIDTNKYLTLSMRLTSVDIAELDFSKPVYLQKTGITGYYFIDEIKAYDGNEPTEVSFVKIGGEVELPAIPDTVIPRTVQVPQPTTPPVEQPCTGYAILQANQITSQTGAFLSRGWEIGDQVKVYFDTTFTDTIIDIDNTTIYLSSNIPGIQFVRISFDTQIDNLTKTDTIYTCAIEQGR